MQTALGKEKGIQFAFLLVVLPTACWKMYVTATPTKKQL